jgi:hypothetical protein
VNDIQVNAKAAASAASPFAKLPSRILSQNVTIFPVSANAAGLGTWSFVAILSAKWTINRSPPALPDSSPEMPSCQLLHRVTTLIGMPRFRGNRLLLAPAKWTTVPQKTTRSKPNSVVENLPQQIDCSSARDAAGNDVLRRKDTGTGGKRGVTNNSAGMWQICHKPGEPVVCLGSPVELPAIPRTSQPRG